jgi:hypothetical protein
VKLLLVRHGIPLAITRLVAPDVVGLHEEVYGNISSKYANQNLVTPTIKGCVVCEVSERARERAEKKGQGLPER